jgi:hypothetical protein
MQCTVCPVLFTKRINKEFEFKISEDNGEKEFMQCMYKNTVYTRTKRVNKEFEFEILGNIAVIL